MLFRQCLSSRIQLDQALDCLRLFRLLPIQFKDFELAAAVKLSSQLNIYAYDAYMLQCALENHADLLTLDQGLIRAAQRANVPTCKVNA